MLTNKTNLKILHENELCSQWETAFICDYGFRVFKFYGCAKTGLGDSKVSFIVGNTITAAAEAGGWANRVYGITFQGPNSADQFFYSGSGFVASP